MRKASSHVLRAPFVPPRLLADAPPPGGDQKKRPITSIKFIAPPARSQQKRRLLSRGADIGHTEEMLVTQQLPDDQRPAAKRGRPDRPDRAKTKRPRSHQRRPPVEDVVDPIQNDVDTERRDDAADSHHQEDPIRFDDDDDNDAQLASVAYLDGVPTPTAALPAGVLSTVDIAAALPLRRIVAPPVVPPQPASVPVKLRTRSAPAADPWPDLCPLNRSQEIALIRPALRVSVKEALIHYRTTHPSCGMRATTAPLTHFFVDTTNELNRRCCTLLAC